MSGFSVAWLDLREPADGRTRAPALLAHARQWLDAAGGDVEIIDLGAGTGSMLRALLECGARARSWHLVDHDAALLQEALRRHGDEVTLRTHQRDLRDVAALPLAGMRLVTASALFDLVSAEFCAALIARVSNERAALYAALNYDGRMQWTPAHPLDDHVVAAFNQDQRRDKGFGPALGPSATAHLQSTLASAGYAITVADSPWLLGPNDSALVRELCRGCAAAVSEVLEAEALQDWLEFRLAHADTGTCLIGHQDLWACPVD